MLLYYYCCCHVAKVVVVESRKTVSLALQLIVLQKLPYPYPQPDTAFDWSGSSYLYFKKSKGNKVIDPIHFDSLTSTHLVLLLLLDPSRSHTYSHSHSHSGASTLLRLFICPHRMASAYSYTPIKFHAFTYTELFTWIYLDSNSSVLSLQFIHP